MTYSIKVYLKGGEKISDGGFDLERIQEIVKQLKSEKAVFSTFEERENNELVEVTV